MLNLSINEQKQILGGEYICIIYDPSGNEYERRFFDDLASAERWGRRQTRHGGSYKAGYYAD